MKQSFRIHPLYTALVLSILGLILGLAMPRAYVASATIFFPSINSLLFKQMTQVLKAEATNTTWSASAAADDTQTVEAASVILRSRAAVSQALSDSNVRLSTRFAALTGDPIESLRRNDIQIEPLEGTTVKLNVKFPRAETARALCQSLLDYYTTFVHDHRLTNTARTREQLEKKLVRVDRRLTVLEKKLTTLSGRGPDMNQSILRPNSKTMRELWRKRILEQGSSQRVLDEMRRVRQESLREVDPNASEEADKDWMSRWGPSARSKSNLPNNIRESDLPSRLELERVYEETLLLYHSALLQHDLLSTWEGLENFDFELVDPVSVEIEHLLPRALRFGGYGLIVGLLLALLLGKRDRPAQRAEDRG